METESPESPSRPDLSDKFRFISIQHPTDAKSGKKRRLARSHAIKQALKDKRKLQQECGENFRIVTLQGNIDSIRSKGADVQYVFEPHLSLLTDTLDQFPMVASDSSRLQSLLNHFKLLPNSRTYSLQTSLKDTNRLSHAPEPVFSVGDELVLRNFLSVFQTSLDDPALLNATMLTFAFAATGSINRECLKYQSQALNCVRTRMESPGRATSESTLGAILLLAGIEARLSMPLHVQLHMGAIQQLLNISQTQGVYLTDGIKRAIFWQDLNSAVMVGSSRIVDHTTFAELQWRRDPFTPSAFILPPGFQKRCHLLTEEFIEVLKDLHALQCIREFAHFDVEDKMAMARIDNHQASIQSRLVGLPKISSFLDCCYLAAYLCSATLRCKLWPASVIPVHLSSQLLNRLQQEDGNPVWDSHSHVLLWLLHIGGAFAPVGSTRSAYITLLNLNRRSRFKGIYNTWSELNNILKQFIWSEKAFLVHVKALWKETKSCI